MAYNPIILSLFALILFAATNHVAHGQTANISGLLCCNSTGNCPGTPVAGAVVKINCTILGVNVTVGQGTTNANGFFNITIPGLITFIKGLLGGSGTGIIPCIATVQLPLSNQVSNQVCNLLSTTTGTLIATLNTVGGLIQTILGLVQNVGLAGGFTLSV